MTRNLLIVVGGLTFGLIVGVLAPSIDFDGNAASNDIETASKKEAENTAMVKN